MHTEINERKFMERQILRPQVHWEKWMPWEAEFYITHVSKIRGEVYIRALLEKITELGGI